MIYIGGTGGWMGGDCVDFLGNTFGAVLEKPKIKTDF